MKIDGFGKTGKAAKAKKPSKAGKARGKGHGAASPASKSSNDKIETSDRIDVSGGVETLDQIRKMVADTPDIRMDEIDRIVGEITSGKYEINFGKVAEGFIKETLMNEAAKRKMAKGN